MRVLCIAPRSVEKTGQFYDFPLGLCAVSASLKAAGHDVACANLNHTDEPVEKAVARLVRRTEPLAVLTGGLSVHYGQIKAILEAARAVRPDVLTVAGGGLVSSEPELVSADLRLDAGVVGEGELTAVELLRAWEREEDPGRVPGLVLTAGGVRRTAARKPVDDLNVLPPPDYDGFEVETFLDWQRPGDGYYLYPCDKPRLLPVISSRSCPFDCTFCYHPLGRKYRVRDLDVLFAEIAGYVARYELNMVAVLDELFAANRQRMLAFCDRIAPLSVRWIAQLRVDAVDAATLSRLKEAGLFYISYGLESASEPILKSMRKKITVPMIDRALEATRECGIGIQGNFLYGDPAETPALAAETLAWTRDHPRYQINSAPVVPYPGSALYALCLERGLIPDRLDNLKRGCPPVNMTAMNQEEIDAIHLEIARNTVEGRLMANVGSVVRQGFDTVKNAALYAVEATCPHCGSTCRYANFHCETLHPFKLACRACNQRFDLYPTLFPHIRARYDAAANRLRELLSPGTGLAVAPCLFEPTFLEYFRLLGLDFATLPVTHILDGRANRIGKRFMDRYPVLPLSRDGVAQAGSDTVFLVLPCVGYEDIVRVLRQACGVPADRLACVPPAGENPA